jgi:putative RecB family exonuclease
VGQPELPIRSYSQLSQLEECPEQYRLKRIERVPEAPAVWFPGGEAFHWATEDFDHYVVDFGLEAAAAIDWPSSFPAKFDLACQERIDKGDSPDLSTWRTAGVSKTLPHGEDFRWWKEHGPEMVRDYVRWRYKTRDRYGIWVASDGTPGIEWDGVAELGGVPVTARADRIMVDLGTGATIIVDLKTGKKTPDNPLQLRIYRMVIERVTAEPMWYGAYYMAREAKLTAPMVLDTTNEVALEERFARAERLHEAGIYLPRPGPNCRQCAVKAHCIFAED